MFLRLGGKQRLDAANKTRDGELRPYVNKEPR